VASIKQAAPNYVPAPSIEDVALGTAFSGSRLVEVQKDNLAVDLLPSNIRALVSINNLATSRGISAAQLRSELAVGDTLSDALVVVSKNVEKNFVIVSALSRPATPKIQIRSTQKTQSESPLTLKSLNIGDIVSGMVTAHTVKHGLGCEIQIGSAIRGTLHPTDYSDEFASGTSAYPPALGSMLKASIVDVDKSHRRVVLSTRPSRLSGEASVSKIADPEIKSLDDLNPGQRVRGFVKSIADAGLFVSISRALDGRVQIKELFDDVRTIILPDDYGCPPLIIFSYSTLRTGSRSSA
jgi:rRNA biogenesis protein RRP5